MRKSIGSQRRLQGSAVLPFDREEAAGGLLRKYLPQGCLRRQTGIDGFSPAPAAGEQIPGRGARVGLPEAQAGAHQGWSGARQLRVAYGVPGIPGLRVPSATPWHSD